jgi:hypothetical protein
MKLTTWIAAIAVIVLPYEGAVLAVNSLYPSCPNGERIRMPVQFVNNGGVSWVVSLPGLERVSDNAEETPYRSPLVICENNRPLGPAHAIHLDIRESGRGRFSHWGSDFVFSTSDNSDPNTNGRSYLVIRTDRP